MKQSFALCRLDFSSTDFRVLLPPVLNEHSNNRAVLQSSLIFQCECFKMLSSFLLEFEILQGIRIIELGWVGQ